MARDLGRLGKNIEQRSALLDRFRAQSLNEVVRMPAAQVGRQAHHHGLRDDKAVGKVEIGAHPRLVDLEAGGERSRMRERA